MTATNTIREEPSKAARIRSNLTHPVIDSDGHIVESQPAAMTYLAEIAGQSAVDRYHAWQSQLAPSPARQLDERVMRLPFWNFPTKNTLDRATVTLPALLNERLAELGFDFLVLYPTMGLIANTNDDDEVRPAACRAFNTYNSEILAEFSDRMTPAAVIPMHSPAEAIEELEYSVRELGAKVVMLPVNCPPAHPARYLEPMRYRARSALARRQSNKVIPATPIRDATTAVPPAMAMH